MTKYEVIQGVYYLYDKWRGGLYTPGLTYIGMNPPASCYICNCFILSSVKGNTGTHMNSKRYFFAYDNMCNLANMRSFPNLWKDNLIKIIDSLHLNNHKRSRCRLQPQCFEKGIAQC